MKGLHLRDASLATEAQGGRNKDPSSAEGQRSEDHSGAGRGVLQAEHLALWMSGAALHRHRRAAPEQGCGEARPEPVVQRKNLAQVAIHETLDETNLARVEPHKKAILRAIFAARPHVLVGSLPLKRKWCFFEVTRVIPAAMKPLAQVRPAIERRLASAQQQRTLTGLISAWRWKWIARTDSARYVIQKCRNCRGPKTLEDPIAVNDWRCSSRCTAVARRK
jgi:hypothetical protein